VTSTPLGKYSRTIRLRFSFLPRSHGLCGCAKYTGSPGRGDRRGACHRRAVFATPPQLRVGRSRRHQRPAHRPARARSAGGCACPRSDVGGQRAALRRDQLEVPIQQVADGVIGWRVPLFVDLVQQARTCPLGQRRCIGSCGTTSTRVCRLPVTGLSQRVRTRAAPRSASGRSCLAAARAPIDPVSCGVFVSYRVSRAPRIDLG
jgi:hypothetical protein